MDSPPWSSYGASWPTADTTPADTGSETGDGDGYSGDGDGDGDGDPGDPGVGDGDGDPGDGDGDGDGEPGDGGPFCGDGNLDEISPRATTPAARSWRVEPSDVGAATSTVSPAWDPR
ncbi:Alpha-amylase [Enhygromyxa salina]|uniref:Alpha-amylase n=1 Tax=Enhygromyxa salina TaxID=215803 RepID=A0A0C2D1Z6_9BACT|nr:hypothetical protein [Enhygromyxa salina]KIG14172.1 Alpha-amylase [Enhygromyxa salina]